MENLPQLVPLVVFIPALGALINYFVGAKIGEKWSGYLGSFAAVLSFIVSAVLLSFVSGTDGGFSVVNPPFLDGWLRIESIGLDIPWQFRVDSLSVTMMMVVTGVGSLIHIYAMGYMHGDPKYSRFFAYLNTFLAFMLILVTGNNFLMMFVGWEGVGLCSYLLIGFWWDKAMPEGWKNSNAAKKAFIVNRVGDFGLLMAMFLIFWTFGTLNFYSPGEINNVDLLTGVSHGGDDHAEAGGEAGEEDHAEDATEENADGETGEEGDDHNAEGDETTEDDHSAEGDETHADEGEHGEDDGHGDDGHAPYEDERDIYGNNNHIMISQLGVFNQADAFLALEHTEEGEEEAMLVYGFEADGTPIMRGRTVHIGPLEMDIQDVVVLIVVFMLLGVTGKSAQIPLFVWLPDAMAGPTPVSALIHAATMVTSGVYLLTRSNVLVNAVPEVQLLITVVGVATALAAGFIALGQWDIKRVLAYSTISQLGFMVAAVGIGAYTAAMFHLVTHAFFKALLFLGSGSVIHGMEHGHHHAHDHSHGDEHAHHGDHFDPQDMRFMGGLRHKMPITFWTYLIGTLALAGIPIFAGFWSKDEILVDAITVATLPGTPAQNLSGYIAFGGLLLAAFFTAFYMWRQIEMVFLGKTRSEAADHAPESTRSMTIPLIILAILSIFGGVWINTPTGAPIFDGIYEHEVFKHFLEHSVVGVTRGHPITFNWLIAIVATGAGIAAIVLARRIYGNGHAIVDGNKDPLQQQVETRSIWELSHARLYWDEFYDRIIVRPFERLATFFADRVDWDFLHDYVHDTVIFRGFNAIADLLTNPFDLGIVDGAVNGVGWVINRLAGRMRRVQTGFVRSYGIALLLGAVVVIIIMLLPLIQNGG